MMLSRLTTNLPKVASRLERISVPWPIRAVLGTAVLGLVAVGSAAVGVMVAVKIYNSLWRRGHGI